MILLLSEPELLMPALTDLTDSFSYFLDSVPSLMFPFKWSLNGFGYLGVNLSPYLKKLFNLNFVPFLINDLERWMDSPNFLDRQNKFDKNECTS